MYKIVSNNYQKIKCERVAEQERRKGGERSEIKSHISIPVHSRTISRVNTNDQSKNKRTSRDSTPILMCE